MSVRRTCGLNLSLLAASIALTVEETSARGEPVAIMDIDRPEPRQGATGKTVPIVIILRTVPEETELFTAIEDLIRNGNGFRASLAHLQVRRSPMPTRAALSPKARRKIDPTKPLKPKPPARKPPLRRKRKP